MKIAIVKLSALGDIVHALVALQFIKAHFPHIQIDWIVEERFAELLNNHPDIDNVLTVNLKALKTNKLSLLTEFKRIRSYAANKYDLIIDAQGLLKSAITARLLGKQIAGFNAQSIREPLASRFYTTQIKCPYDTNTIDRNIIVLTQSLGFKVSSEQILNKKPFLFFHNENQELYSFLRHDKKNIVLVIGSTWASRNYPAEKFINIANALEQNCLVVWGNTEEQQKAVWMSQQSCCIQVMPKLDLNSLKALIASADLVIGNDTGPTHMAWALNRPSITIFGPTPISRVYQTAINKVVKSASIVNPFKLNKNDFSITEINEQDIIVLATELLS